MMRALSGVVCSSSLFYLAVLGLALLVSCSGNDQSSSDLTTDLTIDQYAAGAIDAICANYVRCGQVPERARCHLTIGNSALLQTLQQDVAAMRVQFDGQQARKCLSATAAALKDCRSRPVLSDEDQATCDSIFVGHLSAGDPCFFDEQCSPELFCDQSGSACGDACCAGTCQNRPTPIALGEACNRGDKCEAGAYCNLAGQMGTCTAMITEAGTRCSAAAACATPLACVPDYRRGRTAFTASCLRPVGTGGDCSDAAGNYCDDLRDRCDSASGKCVRYPGVGGACDTHLIDTCPQEAHCDGQTKTCAPLGNIGDPCDTIIGTGCTMTLACDPNTATCQVPVASACSVN